MDAVPRSRSATRRPRRVAVIGAGPIGLEAGLYARALGHDVTVYERGGICENVRRWGFVKLFSPWSLNVSPLGLRVLRDLGLELPPPDRAPRAGAFCDLYLAPLASALEPAVRTHCEVAGIARSGLLKDEAIGTPARARTPFRLLLRACRDGPAAEEEGEADAVLDASGVYATPRALGDGGLRVPGETDAGDRLAFHLPDILGADRDMYAGRTTLLAGAGHSAATALCHIIELAREVPGTRVVWLRRHRRTPPYAVVPDDPLPERARLGERANAIDSNPPACCRLLRGAAVRRIARLGEHLEVTVSDATDGTVERIAADRILALVGYRPDTEIHRELQVQLCYATEGPLALAAQLLGAHRGAGGADCLAPAEFGPSVLAHPEPGFNTIGHKSFGRQTAFLLRTGREQIRDVFRLMEGDPSLDLYAEFGSS